MQTGSGRGVPTDAGQVRVLHVDDDRQLLDLSRRLLEREGFEVLTESDVDAGLERLAAERVDAVVSDYEMPGRDGIEFLRAVRERYGDLPFLLFTGKGSEEVAGDAISAGVTDYLQKEGNTDHYIVLANRVRNAVEQHRVRRENQRLRAYTEHASDMVSVLDDQGTIVYQSPSVRSELGYDPETMLGRDAFEFVHPEDRPAVVEAFSRSIADSSREPDVTYRFRHADGDWRVVESRGSNRLDDPVVDGFVVNSRDVTERERLAADYERTVERMTDAFFAVDAEWQFTLCNEAGREALCAAAGEERTAGELRGTDMWEFIPEAAGTPFEEHYREAMATQSPVSFEAEYPPLDAHFDVRAYPSESGLSIYLHDVTERREREAALERQNERLATLIDFVSHDLRNPLAVAQGQVDIAADQPSTDAEHLSRLDEALDRMDTLIDRLLDASRSRTEVEDPTAHRLAATAEQAWRTVDSGDAALAVADEATVLADGHRLQRLFENLFANAVEHGPDALTSADAGHPADGGPSVTVTVGTTASGFYVADDGTGIPPEERERVFHSGVTSDDEGTGFGLAIVRSIADAHGWSVTATESEAGGARFEVRAVEFLD